MRRELPRRSGGCCCKQRDCVHYEVVPEKVACSLLRRLTGSKRYCIAKRYCTILSHEEYSYGCHESSSTLLKRDRAEVCYES